MSGNVTAKGLKARGLDLGSVSGDISGSIRSELPLTIGGDSDRRGGNAPRGRRNAVNTHSMRATFGHGSATLVVRTFSGDIIIAKR